jgi:hypothetical protein
MGCGQWVAKHPYSRLTQAKQKKQNKKAKKVQKNGIGLGTHSEFCFCASAFSRPGDLPPQPETKTRPSRAL